MTSTAKNNRLSNTASAIVSTASALPPPSGSDDRRKEQDGYLKDEYLFLQKIYEDFDQRLIIIKGWSVTASLAGLAAGFQFKVPYVWLIAAGASTAFWAIETVWKSFQYAYGARIRAIEAHFRNKQNEPFPPFQIYTSWYQAYLRPTERPVGRSEQSPPRISRTKQWYRIATMPMIMLPHILIVTAAVGLFLYHRCHPLWNSSGH